jgi:hypothetical protein
VERREDDGLWVWEGRLGGEDSEDLERGSLEGTKAKKKKKKKEERQRRARKKVKRQGEIGGHERKDEPACPPLPSTDTRQSGIPWRRLGRSSRDYKSVEMSAWPVALPSGE